MSKFGWFAIGVIVGAFALAFLLEYPQLTAWIP
jgi:purine-cytosine permease-like protein